MPENAKASMQKAGLDMQVDFREKCSANGCCKAIGEEGVMLEDEPLRLLRISALKIEFLRLYPSKDIRRTIIINNTLNTIYRHCDRLNGLEERVQSCLAGQRQFSPPPLGTIHDNVLCHNYWKFGTPFVRRDPQDCYGSCNVTPSSLDKDQLIIHPDYHHSSFHIVNPDPVVSNKHYSVDHDAMIIIVEPPLVHEITAPAPCIPAVFEYHASYGTLSLEAGSIAPEPLPPVNDLAGGRCARDSGYASSDGSSDSSDMGFVDTEEFHTDKPEDFVSQSLERGCTELTINELSVAPIMPPDYVQNTPTTVDFEVMVDSKVIEAQMDSESRLSFFVEQPAVKCSDKMHGKMDLFMSAHKPAHSLRSLNFVKSIGKRVSKLWGASKINC